MSSSTYDINKLYPVYCIGISDKLNYTHIQVTNVYGGKPSWSTHNSKMYTATMDLLYKASEWGWSSVKVLVLDHSFQQTATSPITFNALNTTTSCLIYLRGGDKYLIRSSRSFTYEIKTASFTINSKTYNLLNYNANLTIGAQSDVILASVPNNYLFEISSSQPSIFISYRSGGEMVWYNTGTRI